MKEERGSIRRFSRRAFILYTLSLVGTSLALPYWQVVRQKDLLALADNPRPRFAAARTRRGRILDREGRVLVSSQPQGDGTMRRVSTYPPLCHVTGYWSLLVGTAGVEQARDADLSGLTPSLSQDLADTLLHRPRQGHDVVLTIDLTLQRLADEALAGGGAIVALDPRSGAILALASHPWYDPNTIEDDAERLRRDPSQPLLNRATQGLYPPGSTFKTVTLCAAIEMGVATPATRFTYQLYPPDRTHGGWWHQSETRILCQNHPTNASPFDLSEAYQWSCNIAFADLGLRIGAAAYEELAGRFGLGRAIPLDLPSVASQLYHTPGYLTGPERVYALGSTAFGQGELAVTPLQMALIAAGIANAGKIPRPHVVARVQTAEGSVLDTVIPSIWQTAVDPQTAAIVRSMMVASVEKGWARSAAIKGVSVAGKTGTAETGGKETPHSWFIGFAPADDPRIAIAVVKEYAGFGSEQAAPIARRLMAAFLGV